MTDDLTCPKCGLVGKSRGGIGRHIPACKGEQPKPRKPKGDRIAAMQEARRQKAEERRVEKERERKEKEERLYGSTLPKAEPRMPAWGGYGSLERMGTALQWRLAADTLTDLGHKMPDWLNREDKAAAEALIGGKA